MEDEAKEKQLDHKPSDGKYLFGLLTRAFHLVLMLV